MDASVDYRNRIQEVLGCAEDGKLASFIRAVQALDETALPEIPQASIHVLRNYTLDAAETFIKVACYRRGIRASIGFSDYDTYQQEVLDPSSALRKGGHDLVVLALWLDNIAGAFDAHGSFQPEAVFDHVAQLVGQLKEVVLAQIALHTFLPAFHHTRSEEVAYQLSSLNQRIRDLARGDHRLLLVDFDRLVARVGKVNAIDARYWFLYRSPLKPEFLKEWSEALARGVASFKGYARKLLALDCDNTLWGGIIGEDGLNGIKLDAHDYPGNVYQTFQKQALELQRNGVLLALCTKNNEADVLEVLDKHPECLIRRDSLAAWRINWENKAANLQALARELNLGLESITFIDDNPFECDLVRQALPMVDVLQVPQRLYQLPSLLQEYGGFPQSGLTEEDARRTVLYRTERERQQEASSFEDLDTFLASLRMEADIEEPTAEELPRVAQLTQKTNQFNLTTRRYGLGDIEALLLSGALVLRMKVSDKYGEHGLTGVGIVANDGEACRIDTFLMSCRILGKKLEDTFLEELLRRVGEKWGDVEVKAEYLPTPKNAQVADFFDRRGFARRDEQDGARSYVRRPRDAGARSPAYIKVIGR